MKATKSRSGRGALGVAILGICLVAGNLWAANTYYVDFSAGNNTNSGTQEGSAWKHAPGDSNATGKPATTVLQPGDTVLFKGGVKYYGSISITAKGNESNPITFKGDGWGTSKAILDGTNPFAPTWVRCTSADECGGNANWANLWYAPPPADFTILTPLYEDGDFVWFSQSPDPVDPLFYDRYHDFWEVPLNNSSKSMTRTTVKDTTFFTQSSASYWTGAYVFVWATPNVVYPRQITTFDPNTKTITYPDIKNDTYTDRSSWYSVAGHAGIINKAGRFGIYNGKIFIWPKNSDNPNTHTYSYSTRKYGFDLGNCQYIRIAGFEIEGYWASPTDYESGCGIRSVNGKTPSYIEILDNEIRNLRSLVNSGAIYNSTGSYFTIKNNNIHHCQKNTGILCSGNQMNVINNIVDNVGYAGIWFMDATNSRITNNVITNILGTHANGLSVYKASGSGSQNVLVANNRIVAGAGNIPVTTQESTNVWIIGNVIDGMEGSNSFMDWGRMAGTNYFLGNTVARSLSNNNYFGSSSSVWVIRNNIMDGLLGDTIATIPSNRQYNLYTGYSWQQNGSGWTLNTAEKYNTATVSIFTNYDNGDYHLKADSPAIGAGTDISSYFPTAQFPDFDFSIDLEGKPRPANSWHLGAYVPPPVSDSVPPAVPNHLTGKLVP